MLLTFKILKVSVSWIYKSNGWFTKDFYLRLATTLFSIVANHYHIHHKHWDKSKTTRNLDYILSDDIFNN